MMFSEAIRKAAVDLWDELLMLVLFNVVWSVGTLPGLFLIVRGLNGLVLLVPLGLMLLLPWPLVTFALFFVVRDVGEGKAIKFSQFFDYARQTWRPAYRWGGVNVLVLFVLWFNLQFYAGFASQWATLVQLFIIALIVLWSILQVVALPIYPRLAQPLFKLALQNALVVIGRYPLAVLGLIIFMVMVGAIAVIFPISLFFISVVVIAVLANRIVAEAVKREIKREEG